MRLADNTENYMVETELTFLEAFCLIDPASFKNTFLKEFFKFLFHVWQAYWARTVQFSA
jgi:hypothetical protein